MKELRPTCDSDGVYSVKRTCAELGVSHKTLKNTGTTAISVRLTRAIPVARNIPGNPS